MPGSTIIAIIFRCSAFAGMTSLINLYEAPIATVQEKLHVGRKTACVIIAVIGVIVSLLIQASYLTGWISYLLHLPTRSRTRRNHVLLDRRKEICRNTGKQRKRNKIYKDVLSNLQIYLCTDLYFGIGAWDCVRRNWVMNEGS